MSESQTRSRRIQLSAALLAATAGAILFVESPAEANPREHVVVMANMKFGSLPANARVGDTILWVNRGTVAHTATPRNKSFDVRVAAGQRRRMKLTRAGVYPIYCILHPAMRGSLKVAQ